MFQWFKNWRQTRFEPSYQFDENVVRKLIEHRGEVEFLESNDQEFVLKLGEYYFSLWIANSSNQTIVDFYNSFHVVCKDAQKAAQHFKQTKIVNDVLAKLH